MRTYILLVNGKLHSQFNAKNGIQAWREVLTGQAVPKGILKVVQKRYLLEID